MNNERNEQARCQLVDHLREQDRLSTPSVAMAMETVPRHEFVPEPMRDRAYVDRPLRIGHDQVITAPHLVAQMTELLDLESGETVLEIGTGSGYHAAVIAEIVGPKHVVTVERFPDLAKSARDALVRNGYGDVTSIIGDGSSALSREASFDHINVTAVAPDIPDPFLAQLAPDGRMVIPIGPREGPHELVLVTKHDGRIERASYGGVRFVPLIGEQGFAKDE